MNWIWVFIGGGTGSLFRYAISVFFQKLNLVSLPIATLAANLISCTLFAMLYMTYQQKELIPVSYRLLILTGFCGGLSTFSAFSYETFELLRRGDIVYAGLNVTFSLLLCLVVFYLFSSNPKF